jgi:hypothetical protein
MAFSRRQFLRIATASTLAGPALSRIDMSALHLGGATSPSTGGDVLAEWADRGPHPMSVIVGALGTIYFPGDLSTAAPAPLIIWGNGTGGIPVVYRGLFEHWVSWGYIVYASNSTNAVVGTSMRIGIDVMTTRSKTPGDVFHDRVDLSRIASSGHSQGGQAAMNAALDGRVSTTMAIQPGPLADVALLRTPLLLLTGTDDLVVAPSVYVEPWMRDRAVGPMVYGSLRGATHFEPVSVTSSTGFAAVTTAWLEALLRGAPEARRQFFSPEFPFAQSPLWRDVMRNAAAADF